MPIASVFRSALRWFGFASVALLTPNLWSQAGGSAADGFDPNVNGNVYAVAVQGDGRILIAGEFTTIRPNGATSDTARSNIVLLSSDGSADSTFTAGTNGRINAMVVQADGRIVIGGKFTQVNGADRRRIARLNADGTLDNGFNPNIEAQTADRSPTPDVMALVLQADQQIIVGGGFSTLQPNGVGDFVVRNRIARLKTDGSVDPSFNPNANGMVLSLAVQPSDHKILVGGGFTTLEPNPGTASVVVDRQRIARLNPDGTVDDFNPTANNAVTTIEVLADRRIVIGGTFTSLQPNGGAVAANGRYLARLEPDGTESPGFATAPNGPVVQIKVQRDGNLLVGGTFSGIGGGNRSFVARLLPNGSLDVNFGPATNYSVNAFGLQENGSIVLGGAFTTVRGSGATSIPRNHVARVTANGIVDTDFRPDVNGRLSTLMVQSDGKILVAGSFTSVGGETHIGLARLTNTGALDPSFKPTVEGAVTTAIQQGDKIVIGGSFLQVNGVARRNLARLNNDGTLDADFLTAADAQVTSLAMQSDKILLGGGFGSIRVKPTSDPVVRSHLARLNGDGSVDTGFEVGVDNFVLAIVLQADGKMLLGGTFTAIQTNSTTAGIARLGMARVNTDLSIDTSFDPNINGTVQAIAVQSDKKIVVGGSFAQLAPNSPTFATTRNNIVRLNENATVDTSFDPNLNGPVAAIVVQGSGSSQKIYAGGRFTTAGADNATRNYLVRLNDDGKVDAAFDQKIDVLPGNMVVSLAQTSAGKILVGGAFTSIQNGVLPNRLAQLNADGTVDTGFGSALTALSGSPIEVLTNVSGGLVLAAGNFAGLSGTAGVNLAAFNGDGTPVINFAPTINGPVRAVAEQLSKGGAVATQRRGLAWVEKNGQLRSSFSPVSSLVLGTVQTIVPQPDGYILVGLISDGSNPAGSLVRLKRDGTIDPSFKALVDQTVSAIRVQGDGNILIGGVFTMVNGVGRGNLARLTATGELDASFDVKIDDAVTTIDVQNDGGIVVGGNFGTVTQAGGVATTRQGIVRISSAGVVDTNFDPKVNNVVTSVLVMPGDQKILIAGQFTTLQPNGATTPTDRKGIARLNPDGTVDDLDLKVDGAVLDMVIQPDRKVLVGGSFTTIGGTTRNFIARLNADGTVDADFNPNANGAVISIALETDSNKIVIGGDFGALEPGGTGYNSGTATPRSKIARLEPDGKIDSSFNPSFDATVTAVGVAPDDGSIIAAGNFSNIQPNGSLLAGGSFSSINGQAVANLALFSADGSVSSTFLPNPDGVVNAIVPTVDSKVVIAGGFANIAGKPRNRIARFLADDSLDENFKPDFTGGDVYSVVLQSDGKFLVGGSFTTVAGVDRKYLARLNSDGSVDASFNAAVTGLVRLIVLEKDGRILVTVAPDLTGSTNQLVRLSSTGTVATSFTHNNAVKAVALQTDGRIVIGGSFTSFGAGGAQKYLVRLNANGDVDPTVAISPNGAVTALSIDPQGKILIGGTFTAVGSQARVGLARIASGVSVSESFSLNSARTTVTWSRGGAGPEAYAVDFESSVDGVTWTSAGHGTRVPGTSNWQLAGLNLGSASGVSIRGVGLVPTTPNASSGVVSSQIRFNFTPTIISAGVVNAAKDSSFLYAISSTAGANAYAASGLPPGLVLNPKTGVISGTPTQMGTYNVLLTATNGIGSGSTTLTLIVGAPGSVTDAGRVVNLSVLANVSTGNPLIAGFVITGPGSQSILLRAVGPGLTSLGVTGVLAAPDLTVFSSAGTAIHNSRAWGGGNALVTEFARLGAFPLTSTSADAAVLLTLAPGAYSFHVNDSGTAGGVVLAEIYDASAAPIPANAPHLVNISARGIVSPGHDVTGGFVIAGSTSKRVLIRGIGPRLSTQGVTNALANPVITLNHIGNGVIARNNDWEVPEVRVAEYPAALGSEIAAAAQVTGAFSLPTGSTDSAILVTLGPGLYSADVSSADSAATGAAMVEVYEVQ